MRRPLPLAALATAALALTACAPQEEGSDASASSSSAAGSSAPAEECAPESLQTLEDGTLTIATDQPAYEPWVVGDAPESGEGFEAAVAYAVAAPAGLVGGFLGARVATRIPTTPLRVLIVTFGLLVAVYLFLRV